MGANVTVTNRSTVDLASHTREADVIILGAGSPGLLTPDMVKQGAIVLDAGTSEEGGVVKGDANPAVAEKASLFTPTPGGIGPITVAKLFENLLVLDALKHKHVSL
jgi:methylenetetrahydrofolate dehydrogenase (NADP+)/methenyltetrahydrofolate cyclohydrolase